MRKITVDHNEIKIWAKQNGAKPALIDNGGGGISKFIRFKFASDDDDVYLSDARKSVDTSWDDFFKVFEERRLIFDYDPESKSDPSLSFRFMPRGNW